MPLPLNFKPDAAVTMMSTELNSLGNGSAVLQTTTPYDNSVNLNFWAFFWLTVTFGSAPTDQNTVDLYLLPSIDGTTFAEGSATLLPKNCYIGSFLITGTTTARVIPLGVGAPVPILPTKLKLIAANNAGVAFPGSGSTIQMLAFREQY